MRQATLTDAEIAHLGALADLATRDPDVERECISCRITMGAPDLGNEPSPLCNGCAHRVADELAGATRRLVATVRAQAEELEMLRGKTLTTGYTREQLAAAVDLVHLAMHEIEDQRCTHGETATNVSIIVKSAHDALHRVGAGLPRVGCVTLDLEVQAVVAEWQKQLERELPCGHLLADLVSGPGTVTQCGACIVARREAKTAPA